MGPLAHLYADGPVDGRPAGRSGAGAVSNGARVRFGFSLLVSVVNRITDSVRARANGTREGVMPMNSEALKAVSEQFERYKKLTENSGMMQGPA